MNPVWHILRYAGVAIPSRHSAVPVRIDDCNHWVELNLTQRYDVDPGRAYEPGSEMDLLTITSEAFNHFQADWLWQNIQRSMTIGNSDSLPPT